MNIYVGNFSYDLTEDELQQIFSAYGNVESSKIIKDISTGASRGFGFVLMTDKKESLAAIENIKEIKGKKITINEARPKVRFTSNGGGQVGDWGKAFRTPESSY